MSSVRFAHRYLLSVFICAGILVPTTVAAQQSSTPPADGAALALVAERARHAPLTLYAPAAWPQALPEGETTEVKFTVLVAGGAADARPEVSLQIAGLERNVPMQDDGRGPDLSAGDRIYSAAVRFDPTDAKAGRCYEIRASTGSVLSTGRRVCASRHHVGIAAASDFRSSNVIDFRDGTQMGRVLADEVLIRVSPNLDDDQIAALAEIADGHLVGSPGDGIYQIRLRHAQTAETLRQTLQRLQRADGVLAAAPNALGELQAPPVPPVTTNDPLLAQQWGLHRIKGPQAWAIATGDPLTLIAVIDSGADFDHPDFWATETGTDTRFATSDGNLVAADCTSGSCVTVSKPLSCHATGSCNAGNPATDTFGHGTLVAGLIGAAVNNAFGMAGANWQARLLPVRIAAGGTFSFSNLVAGINYARGQGARILSISAGGPFPFHGTLVCPSVAAAESEGRLVVAAAGNEGSSTGVFYPAACNNAGVPTAMPVANSEVNASDQDVIHTGNLASNFGTWISLAAPGTAVLSTARTPDACPSCDPSFTGVKGYTIVTGTSFSTPLAAGAVGLVLARSPSMTNADLRALFLSTGVPLEAPAAHIRRIDVLAALLALNTAPTAINLPGLCIAENTDTTAGTSVGTLSTVDADAGLTGHEYTIVGGADQAKFTIGGVNADQLVITDGVLNFEAQPNYAVRVRSTDVGNLFFEQDLVVPVCNLNEPPTLTSGTFSIPENSPAATVVGSVSAADPDGDPLSFALTAGNTGGAFAISGTGEITVLDSAALDFETTSTFTLTVTASDGTNTTPATVTVNLTNLNEAPTIAGATFTISENSPASTVVGSVSAADPEGAPLTFAITAGNTGGAFAIAGTGQITVANSIPLDFETTPVFTLSVTASDGTTTVPATVTVNLTNINEAPTLSGGTFSLPENAPAGTVVGSVSASDPEGGLLTFAVTAGNTNGAFAISGIGEITVANNAALDFETTPTFTLTITASDGTNTMPATVTVNLTNVNEAPTLTGGAFSLPENSPAGTVVGNVLAADPEGTPLSFAITAGNTGGAFAISANGQITVANSTTLNFETTPTFTLTVTASDGTTTVPATVVVNLTNVNEAPTLTGGTFSIPENSSVGTVIGSVSASDPEGAPLTFALTAGNTGGAFAISGSGQITVANSTPLDFETTPTFTLTVTAADGTNTTPVTVIVNLTDVRERRKPPRK